MLPRMKNCRSSNRRQKVIQMVGLRSNTWTQLKPDLTKDRAFRPGKLYKEIDWSDFNEVVDEFEKRMRSWYFDPAFELSKNNDNGFALLSICVLLIDALSQWESGDVKSEGNLFKKYVRRKLPNFRQKLTNKISIRGPYNYEVIYLADALWHGFRCGILHQAHCPLYGVINRDRNTPIRVLRGVYTYADNDPCTTVAVNPFRLIEDLDGVFKKYILKLKNPSNKNEIKLRENFKKKFEYSFGISL